MGRRAKSRKPREDRKFDREPALRTIALPADANPNGDIFGGLIMAQMDLTGAAPAFQRAKRRVVTVAWTGCHFSARCSSAIS